MRLHGPQAMALQAESAKLHTDFEKLYPSSVTQELTSALTATQGVGASTSLSTSAPPPPRPAPIAPTVPVETLEQKKER